MTRIFIRACLSLFWFLNYGVNNTMKYKYLPVTTMMAMAIASSPVAFAADATTSLPNAKPGECYAKVIVPAQYKTETQEVVVREASEKIQIIPAKYELVAEKVLVKEAGKKVIPVPAVYGEVKERIEVSPARKFWTTSLKKGASPASTALLDAAAKSGINLEAAQVGQCFSEYFVPAKYETKTEKVLVKEASEKIEIIPAKYEVVEEKVLVKEASKKIIPVPATYETVTEKVLVEPAKTVWKKGRGPVERIDNSTGEIMCLVEVPAKYKTVTKRVIKTPATTKVVEIPAEYAVRKVRKLVAPAQEKRVKIPEEYTTVTKRVKVSDPKFIWVADADRKNAEGRPTGNKICLKEVPAKYKVVTRRVVKTPATTKVVEIPAEYKTIKVRKLVAPAQEKRIVIPAKKQMVTKRIKVADEKMEWRQVLCETNMTKEIMTEIQRALKKAGFNPGPIDGKIGSATLRAVDEFQRKNNLERGGLTLDTLKALGVQI